MVAGYDTQAFGAFEREGWQRVGGAYSDSFGRITRQSAEPLLDAVGLRAGMRLLDVCCGPGFVTLAAAARGAGAVGADLTAAMFAATRRAHPELEFRAADAQALPFPAGSFDAVVCSFGILHLPEPRRGVAEAFRVLKPGGRYALTDWLPAAPGTVRGLFAEAMQRHGNALVPLPEGPPLGQFASREFSAQALTAAGFVAPGFRELALELTGVPAAAVLDTLIAGTVRMGALFAAQTPAAQAKIREAVTDAARAFERDGAVRIPCPAALAWAAKP
jgi:ubiquinone/menaquinone biosynthesis C-methylase UbiE